MTIHKHVVLWLVNHGKYCQALSIGQWEEHQKLRCYQLLFSNCFIIKRRHCCVLKLFRKPSWNFENILSKWFESCLHMSFSNISVKCMIPCLKTSVTFANLKVVGNFDEQIASLNWRHVCSKKNSAFSFKTLTAISASWTVFLALNFLISLRTLFILTYKNLRTFLRNRECR